MTTPATSNPIAILRAAAATGPTVWTMPHACLAPAPPPGSGDPMAALMLHLAAVLLADISEARRRTLGLLLGTTRGCLVADEEFDRSRREAAGRYTSPAAFSRTLPSTIAAELSVKLKIGGPMLTLCAGESSTALALRRAAAWLRRMRSMEFCLAGGFEQVGDAVRGALLLLGPHTVEFPGVASMTLGTLPPTDLQSPNDHSLIALMNWIRNGGSIDLAGSVRLQARPTADQ